jgi:death-on-curing protein
MYFPEPERIIRINAKILGGAPALRDRNLLESAAARPQVSVFGEDAYPTIAEKAAALLHSLVLNHPFVDGNKRTATVTTYHFLRRNGLRVIWKQPEALEFIVEVAEGKHDVAAIARWLEANTELIP